MSDMTVANTILEQLGGRRFRVMTGAENFLGGNTFLSFRVPATLTKHRINYVKITLNAGNTYDIEFGSIRGLKYKVVSQSTDIYADVLPRVFTETTGLRLSL